MSLVTTINDDSGKIEVGIFQDQASSAASKHEFAVDVDRDMVAVGGGAIGSGDPGAFLTASHPNEALTAWIVASTDHTEADEHRLEGFALGLKIAGLSRGELLEHIQVKDERRGAVHHPEISATLDPEFHLVSGGFRVIPPDEANLATASYPEFQRSWRAASKDHVTESLAGMQTFAIGIHECLTRNGPLGRIVVNSVSADSRHSDDPAVNAMLDPKFALTGIGALARWTEPGLLLWKLAPLFIAGEPTRGVTAAASDHLLESRGTVKAWAIGIQFQTNAEICPAP